MNSNGKVGSALWLVGVVMLLAGLGSLASPFYLPGGVIGVVNGDRPMNQMSDRYLLVLVHSFGSMVLGGFMCVGGIALTGLGMGVVVGSAAGSGRAPESAIPAEVLAEPKNSPPPAENHLPPSSS